MVEICFATSGNEVLRNSKGGRLTIPLISFIQCLR
ncbi:unnamed protein product [Brassica rapa subsp. trilocularis]